jgi:uncharacterized protein (DUF433 family)/DNA-binding transcriptional MerR regulator
MTRARFVRIFQERDSVKRIPRRPDESIRDFPVYTVPEAAIYLAVPVRTLRYWVTDNPIWPVSGKQLTPPLLSFRDIAQLYYIEIVRKHFHLTVGKTREVLRNAQKESKAQYPLLRSNIRIFLKHILMDKPARGRQPRRLIDLTQGRQMALDEVVDQFSTRIRLDLKGEPTELFPWRYWTPKDTSKPVTINPDIMSGKLVITNTRILVRIVWERKRSGESLAEIAEDYAIEEDAVKQALRHLVPQAA